jgi:hypothetical protein
MLYRTGFLRFCGGASRPCFRENAPSGSQQSGLTIEKEVLSRTTLSLSLLNVRGEHLIRALDVNLPQPIALSYPIFDSTGSVFEGSYYTVDSFATWQFTRTLECPRPPCINPLGRPIAELGSINEFQSAASSNYNGATLSMNRRISRGTYFRLSYAYARTIDDGQDALVAGQPATVQNSYVPSAERGPSVTDQRHRFVVAVSAEPRFFHRGHELLGRFFNDWKISSVINYGTGRPVNAPSPATPTRTAMISAITSPDTAATRLPGRITPPQTFASRASSAFTSATDSTWSPNRSIF